MYLEPRTKLLILAITSVSVFFNGSLLIEGMFVLIPFFLLLQAEKYIIALKYISFFSILLVLQLYVIPLLPLSIAGIMYMFDMYIRKLIPCVMLGTLLIHTTKVSSFLASVGRLGLPKGFTIALSVTLRYFPTMTQEWHFIKDAMSLRGLSVSIAGFLRQPFKMMEYVYVPMLVSASKISDEITQAAITRGIDHTGKRSCMEDVKFSFLDGVVILIYIIIVSAIIFNNLKGGLII